MRKAIFGSAGNQTYQQVIVTGVETIVYPLVLLLNKINETEFVDMPEKAERISTEQYIVNSDEDMELFVNSLYTTADVSAAAYTPEDVLNMTAFGNPERNICRSCKCSTVSDLLRQS